MSAGALAGCATALSDYGAHWLFMESARDRAWLGLRLVTLQAAAGVCAGVSCGLVIVMLRSMRAPAAVRAGVASALVFPAQLWVVRLLFSGGMMSRVPYQGLWISLLAACAWLGVAAAWWLGERVFETAVAAPWPRARRALLLLLAAAFAIGKLNQWCLPRLYDYLHAALSFSSFSVYALAAALGLARLDARGSRLRALGLGLGTALLLWAGYFSARTLDRNQNVRVALLSPNMPHSRALVAGLNPFLPKQDEASAALARKRAAAARLRRQHQPSTLALPQLDDAHVLLITVDALRADHLGLHGYARGVTPELDALGASGVVFEHAYAQAPHSSYSLCSLMTSEYLHETSELGAAPPTKTLPRVLAESGYHSAAFYTQGIFHTAAERLAQYEKDAFGFALHEHQDRPAEDMTDRVLVEVDRTRARDEPSALFWVHYFDVHEPYEATTLGTSDLDRYDSELLATDRAIGRLVREARARLHKPVIVVVTADHGEEFHDHGGVYHGSSLYEEQVHVPLIVNAPGVGPARVQQPVESIDVAPTLLGMLAIERPLSMRGTDLRPFFLQPMAAERGPVFSAVIHKKMVVSWPYKLIADLRFGSFELYDLSRDPRERDNLADREPERVRNLRGEVYAWLDSLTPSAGITSLAAQALEWGRLGDRRAVEPLCALLSNPQADAGARGVAAQMLGKLADPSAAEALLSATQTRDAWVAAEAAIALGRMFDERAARALHRLVASEDPGIRSRAAVSLGRLRDRAAIPALVDALWLAPNEYEREEAVRWLGRLGDASALEPLLSLLPEAHTRHLVVVALGELGDMRAFEPLAHVLELERNANVRDGVVRGLAMLGDTRALPVLLPLISDDPGLHNTGEALVRLQALESRSIGGSDLGPDTAGMSGFTACERGPLRHDWDFQHRTTCTSDHPRSSLRLNVPRAVAEAHEGNWLLISARRADNSANTPVELLVAERLTFPLQLDGAWEEVRLPLAKGALSAGHVRAELRTQPGVRIQLDHVLLIPRTTTQPEAGGG